MLLFNGLLPGNQPSTVTVATISSLSLEMKIIAGGGGGGGGGGIDIEEGDRGKLVSAAWGHTHFLGVCES